MEAEIHFQKQE